MQLLSLKKSLFIIFLLTSFSFASACPICKEERLFMGKILVKERCIDMGGHQLYMQEVGKGEPNIIFESGLGDTSASWDKVIPQVAKFAHAVAYDRRGLGRSSPIKTDLQSITAQDAVDELRKLLKKSQINPPYVLVGHSLGGLYMQLFAQEYPNEVTAVVLVDSATRDQSSDEPLPPEDASYYLEAKWRNESLEQVKNAPRFPNIPLVVLSSGQRGREWRALQNNLLKLSTKSKQVITVDSGHHIQREEPELVIHEVQAIADEAHQLQVVSVINQLISALNKHDVTTALNLFSDDVTWETALGKKLHGKNKLKTLFIAQNSDNLKNEVLGVPDVQSDVAYMLRRVTSNQWKQHGIDYLLEQTEAVIKNNKILYWKSVYTPESAVILLQHNLAKK